VCASCRSRRASSLLRPARLTRTGPAFRREGEWQISIRSNCAGWHGWAPWRGSSSFTRKKQQFVASFQSCLAAGVRRRRPTAIRSPGDGGGDAGRCRPLRAKRCRCGCASIGQIGGRRRAASRRRKRRDANRCRGPVRHRGTRTCTRFGAGVRPWPVRHRSPGRHVGRSRGRVVLSPYPNNHAGPAACLWLCGGSSRVRIPYRSCAPGSRCGSDARARQCKY
jgi:hypothetical protein